MNSLVSATCSTYKFCAIHSHLSSLDLKVDLRHGISPRPFLQPLFSSRADRAFRKLFRMCKAESGNATNSEEDESKEELAARLEKAEMEAAALKRELELRRRENDVDISRLTPSAPPKRIDGFGFRETIFKGPGGTKKGKDKWGLSEAEIFYSKEGTAEAQGSGIMPALEEGAEDVIKRRLIIGLSLSAAVVALSFWKLPVLLSKPSKPLFFYVVPLLELQSSLQVLLSEEPSDVVLLTAQVRRLMGQPGSLKNNLLSAVALLENPGNDVATNLSFQILEYLDQSDYQKYFESRGEPNPTQKLEFLNFSFQSLKVAQSKLNELLKLIPNDDLEAAKLQLSRQNAFA